MTDVGPLCLACALCCSGGIFDVVRLTGGEEEARMSRLGLPIHSKGDYAALLQPCAALDDKRCTIYPDRPTRCIAYRCHLLEAVAADEVSLDEALGVVNLAHELRGTQREQFIDLHFRGRHGRGSRS